MMARGKQKNTAEKIEELALEIQKVRDKKEQAIKAYDEKIRALEADKKAMEEEFKKAQLEELRTAIESAGLTVEEAIKKLKIAE